MTETRLIGAAFGAGAADQRTSHGPQALRSHGLARHLRRSGLLVEWEGILFPHLAESDPQATSEVALFCERLAQDVCSVLAQDCRPVVLGGDHSCAIGTWSGFASHYLATGPVGLIWIDAHLDAHTHGTTPSGNVHGMPLAALLGYGDKRLTHLMGTTAKLLPQHVCLIGARSYEADEFDLLNRLGVRIFDMREIDRRGLNAVMQEARSIAQGGTAAYGISLDIDALDPDAAPGTGCREPGGLSVTELEQALLGLGRDRRFAAMEITEYNPALDRDDVTADAILRIATAVLSPVALRLHNAQELHLAA